MKNKVTVIVCNQTYTLVSDESEAYMQKVANTVNKSMKSILASNDRVSITMAAVFSAINFCDEQMKSTAAADNLRAQLKQYYDDSTAARNELEEAKKQISMLTSENVMLKEKMKKK